ncbi:hypothetical protein BCR35DRAFT_311224 [Leucosporidium creatinivorum]|uniref:Uncharacterized protein n=1 Tax=Leucosporidium creatinivorum TaxID=106004 RepID=A0A1Y2C893_9BASI|nr:hypothetical protein BCR35DRAFT_311224 [Leucosporidium creatinivorum]
MSYRTSIATLATAFPAPPSSGDSRIGSGRVQQEQAAKDGNESMSWRPISAARPRGHGRSASMGGFGTAEREAVLVKRYSVYIPDTLKLPHDSLPSPPTTPPDEEQTARRLFYQLHSTTTKHPFPSAPSSSTFTNRRSSLANFTPPLSPPAAPATDRSVPAVSLPPPILPESRPPSTTATRPLARPTASASTSASTIHSQKSTPSKIKRKPVPQFEEDMEVVDDPLWDPTAGKRGGCSKAKAAPKDSTGVEGQLRRMSVEERGAEQAESPSKLGAASSLGSSVRATRPLPRTKPPPAAIPSQLPSPTLDISPVVRRSGFIFSAPLPGVSSATSAEDRESTTKSQVSSVFNERLSVDTDDGSLRSSSSCAGAASTIATSPSLDGWTPSTSSTSSRPSPSQPIPSSKRVFRPFALLRRKQSKSNIPLNSISAPLEAQAPSKPSKQEDELDRWMDIMRGGDEEEEEEEEPVPRAVARPFRTLTAAERASRASSRLSILSVQSFGANAREDDPTLVSPLVFSVPPLVYSSSSRSTSSREGSSISSRPRTLEEPRVSAMRHELSISAEASEESGVDGEDELSLEGDAGSSGSLDEFVDAPSSRRPSTSSMSSSFTDGSLVEIIGMEPRSEGLSTMMEVDEPPTPNPNHSIHATPKATCPPSPITASSATMAAPPSLFSAFSWTPDAPPPTRTSTPPVTLLAPSDDELSSSRANSPEPTSKVTPVEGKRRTSLTPRPPKPPKSPRRGSKASSGASIASSSIENVLEAAAVEL